VNYIWVALGGALGAMARFGAVQLATTRWGMSFPWGTLTVNVTGSLLIGFLATILSSRQSDPALRLLLITGALGGYTTFSAFSFEALALIAEQRHLALAGYIVGSVLLGLAAAALGTALAFAITR